MEYSSNGFEHLPPRAVSFCLAIANPCAGSSARKGPALILIGVEKAFTGMDRNSSNRDDWSKSRAPCRTNWVLCLSNSFIVACGSLQGIIRKKRLTLYAHASSSATDFLSR
jgi:hypothetical protein